MNSNNVIPWCEQSVLFLIDGEIELTEGRNEIGGIVYRYEKFPWNQRPGALVWSVEEALKTYKRLKNEFHLKPSAVVEKQIHEILIVPFDKWWIATTAKKSDAEYICGPKKLQPNLQIQLPSNHPVPAALPPRDRYPLPKLEVPRTHRPVSYLSRKDTIASDLMGYPCSKPAEGTHWEILDSLTE